MQHFLKDCFTRRNLPFFLFSVVNYSQLCSFRLMHTQFRSILHDLKSFDCVEKHSSEMWLVSNSTYRQDRIKKNKNGTFLKVLTGKNFKIVYRNKVLLVFKNVQNLFFTPKFPLAFCRLMSFGSHHPEFLERLFYKKSLAFFLFSVVNFSQLCSFRPIHTQFR